MSRSHAHRLSPPRCHAAGRFAVPPRGTGGIPGLRGPAGRRGKGSARCSPARGGPVLYRPLLFPGMGWGAVTVQGARGVPPGGAGGGPASPVSPPTVVGCREGRGRAAKITLVCFAASLKIRVLGCGSRLGCWEPTQGSRGWGGPGPARGRWGGWMGRWRGLPNPPGATMCVGAGQRSCLQAWARRRRETEAGAGGGMCPLG